MRAAIALRLTRVTRVGLSDGVGGEGTDGRDSDTVRVVGDEARHGSDEFWEERRGRANG